LLPLFFQVWPASPQFTQGRKVSCLSQEKKQIARVTADENGNYRVGLPPGNYVLDVQDRVRKRVRARPQPFTVVSNQTVRVDMDIDTGIR
jgi:hypothetical protein